MSKQVRTYYHLNSLNIAGMPLNYTSKNISSRRYAPHKFYEGTVNHEGREALFFLQKQVSNNEELGELMNVLAEMNLTNKLRAENKRFEKPLETEGTLRKEAISQDLISKSTLNPAQALYQRFTEDAVIFVPGYVSGVSINEYGGMVSQIETISSKEQSEIERKIREQNFKGPLNFW